MDKMDRGYINCKKDCTTCDSCGVYDYLDKTKGTFVFCNKFAQGHHTKQELQNKKEILKNERK